MATGYTPGVLYGSMECKAGSFVADDCDVAGFQQVTADSTGTVTLNYRVLKGPFGAHRISCAAAQPCDIGVAGGGKAISDNLDFG